MDIDGDSIAYSLVPIYTGCGNVSAVYNVPYSYLNFVSSTPSVSFNNSTGMVSFTPTQIIWGAMNVKATEYRSGIEIGYVTRSTVFEVPWIVSAIEEQPTPAAFSISPMPVTTSCTVKASAFLNAVLILYDFTGRIVASAAFNGELIFDSGYLKPGLYTVEVKDLNGQSCKGKLVKT